MRYAARSFRSYWGILASAPFGTRRGRKDFLEFLANGSTVVTNPAGGHPSGERPAFIMQKWDTITAHHTAIQ